MPEGIQNQETNVGSDLPPEATTYGGLLRTAREGKGLTVDQVASQLRISPAQIEGLEADDYKVFPTPVYARAHLRSYARLLGVDDNKVIDMFNVALRPEDRDPRTFIRKTTQDLAPYQDAQPKNVGGKVVAGLLFLAVLIAAGYFGYQYIPSMLANSGSETQTAAAPAASAPAAPEAKEQEVPAAKQEVKTEPEAEKKAEVAAPSSEAAAAAAAEEAKAKQEAELKERLQKEAEEKAKQKAEEERKAAEAKAAEEKEAAAQTVDTSEPMRLEYHKTEDRWELPYSAKGEVKIKLEGKNGECWFGIYKDNKLEFNTQLKAGQSREYSVALPFKVSVGNRQNGAVHLDGRAVNLDARPNSTSTVFTAYQK